MATPPLDASGCRSWGEAPARVVVVHGGPAAPGSAAPIAAELARRGWPVLEPWQSARSLDALVEELAGQIGAGAGPPVTLIGHSWGALLAALTAARRPGLVDRLVLVASAAFDDEAAARVVETRLARLPAPEAAELARLLDRLADGSATTAEATRLDELVLRADHVDPVPDLVTEAVAAEVSFDAETHASVWAEARRWRREGGIVELGRGLAMPVLVVHGDHDPHPLDAVVGPLAPLVPRLRVEVLAACGHLPWIERAARDPFFAVLERELRATDEA